MNKRAKDIIKVSIIIAIIISISITTYFILKYFSLDDPNKIKEIILLGGNFSIVIFILLQILASIVLGVIPGTNLSFIVLSVAIFGAMNGAIISSIGVIVSSFLMFFIGDKFGEKAVIKIVGKENTIKAQKLIGAKAKIFLPLMFLFPGFPDDELCLVAGMSKIKYSFFLITTILCRPVGVFATAFLGSEFIKYSEFKELQWVLIILLIISLIVVVYKISIKLERLIK